MIKIIDESIDGAFLNISGKMCPLEMRAMYTMGVPECSCDIDDLVNEKGSDIPPEMTLRARLGEKQEGGIFDEVILSRTDGKEIHVLYYSKSSSKHKRFKKFAHFMEQEKISIRARLLVVDEDKGEWGLYSTKKFSDNLYDAVNADLKVIHKIIVKNDL